MPEDMNLEVAHKLTEREQPVRDSRRWEEVFEILGGSPCSRWPRSPPPGPAYMS